MISVQTGFPACSIYRKNKKQVASRLALWGNYQHASEMVIRSRLSCSPTTCSLQSKNMFSWNWTCFQKDVKTFLSTVCPWYPQGFSSWNPHKFREYWNPWNLGHTPLFPIPMRRWPLVSSGGFLEVFLVKTKVIFFTLMAFLRPAEAVGACTWPLQAFENPPDLTDAQLWLGLEGPSGPPGGWVFGIRGLSDPWMLNLWKMQAHVCIEKKWASLPPDIRMACLLYYSHFKSALKLVTFHIEMHMWFPPINSSIM